MKVIFYHVLLILLLSNFSTQSEKCFKLAFGSCFKMYGHRSSKIFDEIGKNNPDAFLWLGDVAYLDQWTVLDHMWYNEKDLIKKFRIKWEQSVNDHYYVNFKNKIGKENIYSIWDDHDYGIDNGDKNWEMKDVAKDLFLEYMGEPLDSARWARNGLYESYRLSKNIQLIILDNRYNLMPPEEAKNADFKDSFGEEQWEWFEKQISNSDAKIVIIGSGIQFVDQYKAFIKEEYFGIEHIYPDSTKRIYEVLRKYNKSGVFFQSGDIHSGEINIDDCSEKILGYKTVDFTSSGLDSAFHNNWYYGFAKSQFHLLFHQTRVSEHGVYYGNNFGIIEICPDEQNNDYTIKGQIHGQNGLVFEKEQSQNKDMTFKDNKNKSLGHKNLKSHDEYDKCTDKGSKTEMSLNRFWNTIFTFGGIWAVFELIIRLAYQPIIILLILYLVFRVIRKFFGVVTNLFCKRKIKQE